MVSYKTIDQLGIGESAIIKELNGDHPSCLRLMDLGFTPGQQITLMSVAPMRDPIAIALRGTIIALRRKDASCIKV